MQHATISRGRASPTRMLLGGFILLYSAFCYVARCTNWGDTFTKRVNATRADTSSCFLGLLLSTESQNINHTLVSGDSILRARASVLVDIGEVSERLLPGVGGEHK